MRVVHYSNIGKRSTNEDHLGVNDNCLVVCDGVGGQQKGEVASTFVVNRVLEKTKDAQIVSADDLKHVAHEVQQEILQEDEQLKGMATTLAMVYTSKNGLFTLHIGDSRIIIVKKDGRYWQTWDHSVVATMVKLGEISLQEARVHPLKNQITNAIVTHSKGKMASPEVNFLSDIEAGDLCFICTDGVLEAFEEKELILLLGSTQLSLDQKLDAIKQQCLQLSRDNNSAILGEFESSDIELFTNYPSTWTKITGEP
ncbi:PP2C family protein-serine/threonine phosphatase [Flagellimonas myxillae]|uniref:PP2C family protein-serine/threonine phosphatase n=1 Tax=Flagellimonas myxillae TaxID=2942214 RepID=UPI00201F3A5F|nr:PP2C family serine/threonine-protein phosphatase [Muricauda myxillae]MCL6265070.1 protein phosphatase 2C domain-containing protein [Muricauda myxillae]